MTTDTANVVREEQAQARICPTCGDDHERDQPHTISVGLNAAEIDLLLREIGPTTDAPAVSLEILKGKLVHALMCLSRMRDIDAV